MNFTKKLYKIIVSTNLEGFVIDKFVSDAYEDDEFIYVRTNDDIEYSINRVALDKFKTYFEDWFYPEVNVYTFDESKIDEYVETMKKMVYERLELNKVHIEEMLKKCEKDMKGSIEK